VKRCSGALNGSACNESERGLGVCTGEGVSQRIHRIGIMEISKELGQQRGTEGPRRGRERGEESGWFPAEWKAPVVTPQDGTSHVE